MTVDITKLAYSSEYPIDKVVATETVSVVNDGATSDPQTAKIVSSSITNPYGSKCFVRAKWSVDGGTTYNSLDSRLHYTFSYTITTIPVTNTFSGLKAAVVIGVSNSTITFRTANGFHGNVSDDGVTVSYTPTSLTFDIKYALYEVN